MFLVFVPRTTNNLEQNLKLNRFKISIHECSFVFQIEQPQGQKGENIFQIAKI